MADKTLAELSEKMRDIDFCVLSTRTEGGEISGRPMSNNGEVDYEGDSWFFAYDDARSVSDIAHDPKVGLGFQGTAGTLGMRPFFVTLEGEADLVRDKAAFEEHWTSGLDRWFEQGVDTPGLVMIHVRAQRVHYWDGEDEGEIRI